MRLSSHCLFALFVVGLFEVPGVSATTDIDGNGVDDVIELQLAQRFAPSLMINTLGALAFEPKPVEILNHHQVGGPLTAQDLRLVHFLIQPNPWAEEVTWANSPFGGSTNYTIFDGGRVHREGDPPNEYWFPHFEYGGPYQENLSDWTSTFGNDPIQKGDLYQPTIYVRLYPTAGGAWYLEYWFFYPFNDWINKHEGDWEHIRLKVTFDGTNPLASQMQEATFYFHISKKTIAAAYLPQLHILDGTHVVVFVGGTGSGCPCPPYTMCAGGNYDGGSYPAPGLWPDAANISHCFDEDDDVRASVLLPYDAITVTWMPDVRNISTASSFWEAHPDLMWVKSGVSFGHVSSPSPGSWAEGMCFVPRAICIGDVGNNGPQGPFWQADGDFGDYNVSPTPFSDLVPQLYVIPKCGNKVLHPTLVLRRYPDLQISHAVAPCVVPAVGRVEVPHFFNEQGLLYEFIGWSDDWTDPLDPYADNASRMFNLSEEAAARPLYRQVFTPVNASTVGITANSARAAAWGDFDGDGKVDLVLADGASPNHLHLYKNEGSGSFTDVTSGELSAPLGSVAAITCADYNNDGRLDIYVSTGLANALFRNDGSNTFHNVAAGTPVEDEEIGQGVGWADYDGDGWVDVYLANNGQNALIRNTGLNGQQWSWTSYLGGLWGQDVGISRAAAWADYDKDTLGRPDLMLSNHGWVQSCDAPEYPNRLLRNTTTGPTPTFVMANQICDNQTPRALAGAHANALAWGDFNNDSHSLPDLLLLNDAGVRLVENVWRQGLQKSDDEEITSDSTLAKVRDDVGLPTTEGHFKAGVWLDIDNDGDQDLCLAREDSTLLFENFDSTPGPTTLTPMFRGAALAPASTGALAWGDYDGDGDLDLFISCSNACYLYRNEWRSDPTSLTDRNYLQIDLVGTRSNRSGIGAQLRLVAFGVPGLDRQFREVEGGSGYGSFNSLTAAFGLASATIVDSLKIVWPSGKVHILTHVSANQHLVLTEPVVVSASATVMTYDIDSSIPERVVCPQGDGAPLRVRLRFLDQPRRTIAASELTLGAPTAPTSVVFFSDNPPGPWIACQEADSAATNANGYSTRFSHKRMGGSGTANVPIYWNGVSIATASFSVKSPDYGAGNSSPGFVDASDLSRFARVLGHHLGEPLYEECSDFVPGLPPPSVDASDFAHFAEHYQHRYSVGGASKPGSGKRVQSPVVSIPMTLVLTQNTPNPFNPTTRIHYVLPEKGPVQLLVMDVRGRVVRTLIRDLQDRGEHNISWDGRDDRGLRVSSGVYFYNLEAQGGHMSKRMVVVR